MLKYVLRPWQTRKHWCGHIVAVTNVSPFARERNICCGHKFCVLNKCFPVCAAQETSWATMCPQQCVPIYQGLYVSQGSTNTAPQATPGKIWLKLENQSQDIREVVLLVTLVKNNSYCKPFDCAIVVSECTDFFCYLETNSLSFCFLFTHSEWTASVTVFIH